MPLFSHLDPHLLYPANDPLVFEATLAGYGSYWSKNPKFDGFGGFEEGRYGSMAKFMVEQLRRFEEFRDRSLNAHSKGDQSCTSLFGISRS
ncbi:hypothetical protein [Mesorhizobium sp. M0478]|uniref:hypothetical protein n=1 Tax=Mesorhizobium sp. M0478 TaxID=2956947 RepID=UPI0033368EFE